MKYSILLIVFLLTLTGLYMYTVEKQIQCLDAKIVEQKELNWLIHSLGKARDNTFLNNYVQAKNNRINTCK